MLNHLGHEDASRAIMQAIEATLKNEATRTHDLVGTADRQRAAGLWPLRFDQQQGPVFASKDTREKTVSIA
jgi:hypothetical protein